MSFNLVSKEYNMIYGLFKVLSNARNHAEIGNYPKVSMESCGLTAIINKKSPINERIVNGENASLGEFPWMISIKLIHRSSTFWCGGAIINQYWILTSIDCFRLEKCFKNPSLILSRIRKYNNRECNLRFFDFC